MAAERAHSNYLNLEYIDSGSGDILSIDHKNHNEGNSIRRCWLFVAKILCSVLTNHVRHWAQPKHQPKRLQALHLSRGQAHSYNAKESSTCRDKSISFPVAAKSLAGGIGASDGSPDGAMLRLIRLACHRWPRGGASGAFLKVAQVTSLAASSTCGGRIIWGHDLRLPWLQVW